MIYNVDRKSKNPAYIKYLTIFLSIALLTATGWFGYRWYTNRIEADAYKSLSEIVGEYNKFINTKDAKKLEDIERAFATGASRYSNSHLYPYFLLYQSDLLLNQSKNEQALALMNQALEKLNKEPLSSKLSIGSKSNLSARKDMFYLYSTKKALVELDMPSVDTQLKGQKDLMDLSEIKENPFKEMGLYELGLNFWTANKLEEAEKVWKKLIALNKESSWSLLAQQKLSKVGQ